MSQPATYPGLLFVVSAPSGAGKTSIVNALVADDPNIVVSVSHTTRARRGNEGSGMAHTRIRKFNTRDAYPDQRLDNDVCMVVRAGNHIFMRGQTAMALDGSIVGIGDAAAVLFTAGYTDRMPDGLLRPVASLPLAVFFQLGTPFPEVQQRAYASALVLTIMVLIISLGSRLLARRLSRNVVK